MSRMLLNQSPSDGPPQHRSILEQDLGVAEDIDRDGVGLGEGPKSFVHALRLWLRLLVRFHPSFIPGGSALVGWLKLCHGKLSVSSLLLASLTTKLSSSNSGPSNCSCRLPAWTIWQWNYGPWWGEFHCWRSTSFWWDRRLKSDCWRPIWLFFFMKSNTNYLKHVILSQTVLYKPNTLFQSTTPCYWDEKKSTNWLQ